MPRSISAANLAALEEGRLVARDFLWIVARDRGDGSPVSDGMWSGAGYVTASVVDPNTGLESVRDWYGAGSLVQIDPIPLVSNLTVQTINILLSQVDEHVSALVRTYDCQQAVVQIFRGLFDPDTRQMVAPAEPRFVGFVDRIEIKTPAENQTGGVTLICVSHTQEMTRSNPDTRSHESQILRSATDGFFKDAGTASEWEIFWGSQKGKVPTAPPRKKFLGIF